MSLLALTQKSLWKLPTNAVRFWWKYGTWAFFRSLGERCWRFMEWHLPRPISQKTAVTWQQKFTSQPLVSIVVPVYRTPSAWFEACVQSVQNQYYENWELILVDDASGQPEFTEKLEQLAQTDSRIWVIALTQNSGIAEATNVGIDCANGEFVGFLDHDDELTPDALTWIVAAHNAHPQAVWMYSDEDKIPDVDQPQKPFSHVFKPAYSDVTLLSGMYTCHFSVYAKSLLTEVGRLRAEYEGAQDFDLALRLSECVSRDEVVHIPRVLYHWRTVEGSTAADAEAKPIAVKNGRKAVRDALARRGISGEVASHPKAPTAYTVQFHANTTPTVRILIPTYNGYKDLKTCLESIERRTFYPNVRTTVIDNRSNDPKVLSLLADWESCGKIDVVRDPRPFNHSEMHNDVIAESNEKYIVFMNNDVELLTDRWLEQLVGAAEMEESIAGVGTLLIYPDRTIQHGGIYLGAGGVAGHAFCGLDHDDLGYCGQAQLLRETSGATAALLLMRRSAFEAVGGFDAEQFPTSFNDVDLWMKLCEQGYRCLYNPRVQAIHYESKTRVANPKHDQKYIKRFIAKWGDRPLYDPFYHPHIDLINQHCCHVISFRDRREKDEIFRCLPRRENTETQPMRRAA